MIHEIPPAGRAALAALYAGHADSLVLSCLEGQGFAWADDPAAPRCAAVALAGFVFLTGDASAPGAGELVGRLLDGCAWEWAIVVPGSTDWAPHTRACWPRHRAVERWSLDFAEGADLGFDRRGLRALALALPEGCVLRRFDAELYAMAMAEDWADSFCDNFRDCADFLKRGRGWAVMKDGALVAGCSSYTCYGGGIESQVATREDHQRKGLAAAASAMLILECLDLGLRPHWDAANETSKRLAERLGYRARGTYTAYGIAREAEA